MTTPTTRKFAGLLAVALGLIGAQNAMALTTQTSQFQVNLTLQAACTITSSALNFGTQGVLTSAINQSTQLSVTCTNSAPYSIGLDAGNVTGSAVSSRLLQAGAGGPTVAFQLYQDSSRSQIWGNTVGVDALTGVGNGSAQTLSVYGQIAPQSTPAAGTYSTTITATISF
ncbi:Csu type fimbrial protein [Amantichitinum ursilacus]|uniref:Spore Coat Protein U domain protein n=1 Tax=Amantichitinum ursilacus TaxID=857265 RepID=A0A0N1JSR3_9NEIS|nr:spore coat U domain-containing protein [Amantichitinum ursilacus]KPC52910.1 Spore Coat Protein U domain protein [Amantichitinum ursilacus]